MNYSEHYFRVNGIDPESEESVENWYAKGEKAAELQLEKILGGTLNSSILDLGCGTGTILKYLKNKGCKRIVGVDSSKELLKLGAHFFKEEIIHDDIFAYLRDNQVKFDVIIIFDVIEHIEKNETMELLSLVYDTLNDHGRVLIRTPNMGSLISNYFRYFDFTHTIGYTESSLSQILNSAKFKDVQLTNTNLGWKRKFFLDLIYGMVFKIFSIRKPKIISANLLAIASKNDTK